MLKLTKPSIYWVFVLCVLFACENSTHKAKGTANWKTYWEKSDYLETPRYEATIAFSQKLASASPMLSYQTFGTSPQGRELPLLVLDKDGFNSPQAIKGKGRAVVLVQAGIHPGEADGKDAGLALLRDIIIHKKHTHFLDSVSLLFIPIFNVDGHERFSPYSRINQNGPKEGGWRTTAHNLNLNRDYVKADAPEMQAWLRLYSKWNPEFFIDCHTTDGADYQYAVTYATDGFMAPMLDDWVAETYLPKVKQQMEEANYPMFPYIVFRRWHDPRSGLVRFVSTPRYSNGYSAARNRPGLLIETHMLKDYKTRVFATYELILKTLNLVSEEKNRLQNIIKEADAYTASEKFRNEERALKYEPSQSDSIIINFKGIDYTIEKSDLTGGDWVRFNGKKMDFKLPVFEKFKVETAVKFPSAYVIPAEWQNIIDRLDWHGIRYERLPEEKTFQVEKYKFSGTEWAKSPYEGRFLITKTGIETFEQKQTYPTGSVIVPMNQPNAYLIAFMLEPASDESFLKWGFFNAIFEQKEYVETYIMEKKAREMLAQDPKLKAEFEAAKEQDESLKSPYNQLMWFYRRTPYFDQQLNVYPIGRIID